MSFGFPIDEPRVAYWGARAIYKGYQDDYRIDLLFDRQSADDANEEFINWVNNRALPWLRDEVRKQALATDSSKRLEYREFKYVLRATPNGSYGYLYIGAAELEVTEGDPHHNDAAKRDEPVWVIGDRKYVFQGDIPPIGTRGTVKVNDLGDGTVVGYHTAQYGESGDLFLLSLEVELDDPPKWWQSQTLDHDKAELILKNVWMLKPKFEKSFHEETDETRRRTMARNISGEAPSKLFNRDGMEHWKEWKASYKFPPATIWDVDFTLIQKEVTPNG